MCDPHPTRTRLACRSIASTGTLTSRRPPTRPGRVRPPVPVVREGGPWHPGLDPAGPLPGGPDARTVVRLGRPRRAAQTGLTPYPRSPWVGSSPWVGLRHLPGGCDPPAPPRPGSKAIDVLNASARDQNAQDTNCPGCPTSLAFSGDTPEDCVAVIGGGQAVSAQGSNSAVPGLSDDISSGVVDGSASVADGSASVVLSPQGSMAAASSGLIQPTSSM
jgi:hypothetical protein